MNPETNNKKQYNKGERGYLDHQHRSSLVRFLLPCVITVILTLCTWIIFPQYGMVFLVLAVISAIPTAMAAVNLIMFMRYKSIGEEEFKEIEEARGNVPLFYDSVLTTTEKSYFVPCIAVMNKNTMLLIPPELSDEKPLVRHLTLMFKKNGFKEWNIRIFKERKDFIERLKSLNEQNIKVLKKDQEMIKLISNLSL